MEVTSHAAASDGPRSAFAMPRHLPLVLCTILVLECLVVLHTLQPVSPGWQAIVIGQLDLSAVAVLTLHRRRELPAWYVRMAVGSVVGIVIGEVIAYFVAVPWELTWIAYTRAAYDVGATMFLRLVCLFLAIEAWKLARANDKEQGPGHAGRRRGWYGGGVALGLLMTLPVAFIPVLFALVRGHRPALEVEAETRASAQLGPEYSGYRYLVRQVDQVFRRGESVTISASVIAFDLELTDLRDVELRWKESWR